MYFAVLNVPAKSCRSSFFRDIAVLFLCLVYCLSLTACWGWQCQSNKGRRCQRQVNGGIGQCQQPCASQIPLSRVTGRPREREYEQERERVSQGGTRGVKLGRVLSGLITPDSCNLQVGSRGKSARFTLLRVSICRHYGTTLDDGRSASRRNGKQQNRVWQISGAGKRTFHWHIISLTPRVCFAAAVTNKTERRERRGGRYGGGWLLFQIQGGGWQERKESDLFSSLACRGEYLYRKTRHHYVKSKIFADFLIMIYFLFLGAVTNCLQVPFVHSMCGIIYKKVSVLCEVAEAPSRNAPPSQDYPLKRRKLYSKLQFVPSVLIRPTAVHSLSRPWFHILSISLIDGFWQGTFLSSPWRTFCCPAGHVLPSSKHNSLYIITTLIQNGEDCLLNFRITCWSDYTFEKWSTNSGRLTTGSSGSFPGGPLYNVGWCSDDLCYPAQICATSHLKG